MFKLNTLYTRTQIHEVLGGDLESYLPHRSGTVVCGCFEMDKNPNAPNEILVGDAVNVVKYAKVLSEQTGPIPIFIKQAVNEWKYIGDYRAIRYSDDTTVVSKKAYAAGRVGVAGVLFLRRASR